MKLLHVYKKQSNIRIFLGILIISFFSFYLHFAFAQTAAVLGSIIDQKNNEISQLEQRNKKSTFLSNFNNQK